MAKKQRPVRAPKKAAALVQPKQPVPAFKPYDPQDGSVADAAPDLPEIDRMPASDAARPVANEIPEYDERDYFVGLCGAFQAKARPRQWEQEIAELEEIETSFQRLPQPIGLDHRRAYLRCMSVMLRLYQQDRWRAAGGHDAHGGHLPLALIADVVDLMEHVATGRMPDDLITQGKLSAAPSLSDVKGIAVAYRKACHADGLSTPFGVLKIEDASPIKTLADWYEVDRRTIMDWVSTMPPKVPFTGSMTADRLTDLVRSAAQWFQQHGASNSANLARRRKG